MSNFQTNRTKTLIFGGSYLLAGQLALYAASDHDPNNLAILVATRLFRDITVFLFALVVQTLFFRLENSRTTMFQIGSPLFIYLLIGYSVSPAEFGAFSTVTIASALQVIALVAFLQAIHVGLRGAAPSAGHEHGGFSLRCALSASGKSSSYCLAHRRRYERPLSALILRLKTGANEVFDVETSNQDGFVDTATLERCTRETDFVVHTNDENECLILCPETSVDELEFLAGRLKTMFERSGLALTYSLGAYPKDAYTLESLVEVLRQKLPLADDPLSSNGIGTVAGGEWARSTASAEQLAGLLI